MTRRGMGLMAAGIAAVLVVGVIAVFVVPVGSSRPHHVSAARLAKIRQATDNAVSATGSTTASTASTGSTTGAASLASTAPLRIPTTVSHVDWVSEVVHITYDGLARRYLVFRPAHVAAGAKLPVLVELSGSSVIVQQEAKRADFRQVAGPAILVYPQAYDEHWDAGACCGLAATDHISDVGFVSSVIAKVKKTQAGAADSKVYLAGYSNGGKMALRMACADPRLFTAVAVFGAVESLDCHGPPAESVLETAGLDDPELTVGPGGTPTVQNGFTEPTVTAEIDSYLKADGCSATSQQRRLGSLTATRWSSCSDGHADGLVLFADHGHGWPEKTATTPSEQQVMWDYFVDLGA